MRHAAGVRRIGRLGIVVLGLGLGLGLGLAATGACKGKDPPPAPTSAPPPAKGSAATAAAPDAWTTCKAALVAAPATPATRRAASIIDACQPCGDWRPILTWTTLPRDGGPNRKLIEQTMTACNAWCEASAKIRFMGALDDARAKDTRTPWRALGEVCKEQVSAVPDPRFMSAPLFALDRIARDVAKRPEGAKLLAAIEIPLPAVSGTGVGVSLPESPLTKPTEPTTQLTVSMTEFRIGPLPRARLGATGLTVTGATYPGEVVSPGALAAALARLATPGAGPVAVFAPHGMAASRIAELAAAAGPHTLHLAVIATGPIGWSMHGTVPIALGGKPAKPARSAKPVAPGVTLSLEDTPDAAIAAAKAASREALKAHPVTIELLPGATVGSLAKLLGALAFFEVSAVLL